MLWRKAGAVVLLVSLTGCVSFEGASGPAGGISPNSFNRPMRPRHMPGFQGPHGQKVAMAAPYNVMPKGGDLARTMFEQSIPLSDVQLNQGVQQAGFSTPGGMPSAGHLPNTLMPPGGIISPPGIPFAPGAGPSGPIVHAHLSGDKMNKGKVVQAGMTGVPTINGLSTNAIQFPIARTQIRFAKPSGMKVSWFTKGPDGKPQYSETPIETPGRYNFPQAAVYRLKLDNIAGRPGLQVYPTLEVVPANPKTQAFLAHSAVPVEFTDEDFDQIVRGNYVVKVIYLPNPEFQELAGTGIEEILSTRLEPGADPIREALRRGSILLVIRMGNVDQEAPNTPPLGAKGQGKGPAQGPGGPGLQAARGPGVPFGPPGAMPPGLRGMMPPPGMMPPGMVPPGMMRPGAMPPGRMPLPPQKGFVGAPNTPNGRPNPAAGQMPPNGVMYNPMMPPPGMKLPPPQRPGAPNVRPQMPPTQPFPAPGASANPVSHGSSQMTLPGAQTQTANNTPAWRAGHSGQTR